MKPGFIVAGALAAALIAANGAAWGQDAATPAGDAPSSSLGDVARQTRAQRTSAQSNPTGKAASTPSPSSQSKAGGQPSPAPAASTAEVSQESESQSPSVAELARQSRASRARATTTPDNADGVAVPAGYESFTLQYCRNPQQCAAATLAIPDKAEVVSSTNGQCIFKTQLNGEAVLLYAGPADVNAPYRSLTDPDFVRLREIAASNGNETAREKAQNIRTQELTVDGKYSVMTRFRYQRDQLRTWVGERVVIQNRDTQFLVGCAAPEEHFSDAEKLCNALVDSLRLP